MKAMPFQYKRCSRVELSSSAEAHYRCLALDETAALPVGTWPPARPFAVPHMASALAVMKCPGLPVRH
jgi:hypothetical protein